MNWHTESIPRVGVVGVSGYGRIHLGLLREAEDAGLVKLSAAVVINREEEAAVVEELGLRGVRVHPTFDAFIASEPGRLELCFLPTGIRWHAPMTMAALCAGMNVLVEKPLAGSLEEANAILETERKSGKFVAVGFQDMYVETTRWLKMRLVDGAIGEVKSIRFVGIWPRSNAYYSRNQWAGRVSSDGIQVLDSPFNNALAHFVHLSLFLGGDELDSTAHVVLTDAELLRAHQIESFDTGVIRAESASGVKFWFGASHASSEQREPEIHIEGTRGRAVWLFDDRCTITRQGGGSEQRPVPTAEEARREMTRSVIRRLADPTVFISTAASAREHTALMEAVHRSSRIDVVDASRVDRVRPAGAAPGEFIPSIRGLPAALARALKSGSLLREAELSVGQPFSR